MLYIIDVILSLHVHLTILNTDYNSFPQNLCVLLDFKKVCQKGIILSLQFDIKNVFQEI